MRYQIKDKHNFFIREDGDSSMVLFKEKHDQFILNGTGLVMFNLILENNQTQKVLEELKKIYENNIFSVYKQEKNYDKLSVFDKKLITPYGYGHFESLNSNDSFDYKKIAFIHYNIISDLFYMNDFNWMVAPSNYDSKEFNLIVKKIQETSSDEFLIFDFEDDDVDLRKFIKSNFKQDNKDVTKIKITKSSPKITFFSLIINLIFFI